jgi:hypothetical protein
MSRYEIAIANATENNTWGNDLPRSPLWGTMGQVIPLFERKGNPAQNAASRLLPLPFRILASRFLILTHWLLRA